MKIDICSNTLTQALEKSRVGSTGSTVSTRDRNKDSSAKAEAKSTQPLRQSQDLRNSSETTHDAFDFDDCQTVKTTDENEAKLVKSDSSSSDKLENSASLERYEVRKTKSGNRVCVDTSATIPQNPKSMENAAICSENSVNITSTTATATNSTSSTVNTGSQPTRSTDIASDRFSTVSSGVTYTSHGSISRLGFATDTPTQIYNNTNHETTVAIYNNHASDSPEMGKWILIAADRVTFQCVAMQRLETGLRGVRCKVTCATGRELVEVLAAGADGKPFSVGVVYLFYIYFICSKIILT